jgi:DNA processing protein
MNEMSRAHVLALAEQVTPYLSGPSAARLARLLDESGLEATLQGSAIERSDEKWLREGLRRTTAERVHYWKSELDELERSGVTLVLVTDAGYPRNLRLITNLPPLLFMRGTLHEDDERAMAVVGTRSASEEGIRCATWLARELAERRVTVVSGLAAGIDTAAHAAALNAHGRTLAVFGTGIRSIFPAANRGLARSIEHHGACLSQFWPDQRGARWTFPLRNIVTSGLSLGTIVVEASETSGARLQAEDALRHGKRLFLLDLVMSQPWAVEMAERPGVTVVKSVEQVIEAIDFDLRLPELDLVF